MIIEHIDSVAGTSLKGRIASTYYDLVDALGEPITEGLDGSTVDWRVEIEDDYDTLHTVCVYDRHQDSTPKGQYDWYVGAHNLEGCHALSDYLTQAQALANWNRAG